MSISITDTRTTRAEHPIPLLKGQHSREMTDIEDIEEGICQFGTIHPGAEKGAEIYPEITWLGEQFAAMKIYREWSFDRNTPPRKPQQVDLPEDFLLEDASNLALVLNDILHRGLRKTIIDKLNLFYEVSTTFHESSRWNHSSVSA